MHGIILSEYILAIAIAIYYCSLIMRWLIILWMIVMLQHFTGAQYPDCISCTDGKIRYSYIATGTCAFSNVFLF